MRARVSGSRASRPTAGAWRSSSTESPSSLVGKVAIVDQTGAVTALSAEYLNVHGLAWNGDEIWYTAADEQQLFRALCAVTPGGTRRTITRMPGNADAVGRLDRRDAS